LQSIIPAPVASRSCLTRLGLVRLADRFLRLGPLLGSELSHAHLALADGDRIRDQAHDQIAGAHGVIVPGNYVRRFVGVAVRVDQRDHREAEPLGLTDCELLLSEIDDEDGGRLPTHVGDTTEVRLELLQLALHGDPLLGGQEIELPFLLETPQLVQVADALGDGAPVRQQATQPAVVDERHADAPRMLLDGVLRLLLGADEEDDAPPLGNVPRIVGSLLEQLLRLLQIDDVDAPALGEDVAPHLRVPAARLVAEVHTSFEQLLHGDDCQRTNPFRVVSISWPAGAGGTGLRASAPPPVLVAGSAERRSRGS
jgi:hypothetical protein